MCGEGTMKYADGSNYSGSWDKNLMEGKGTYIDPDQTKWVGIFVQGAFESKIQKKLAYEKTLKDNAKKYEENAKEFFIHFQEAFAKSDKKTFKEHLSPSFATPD